MSNISPITDESKVVFEPIMQFFVWGHLPKPLQIISEPFGHLAANLHNLPRNPERTVALRKLLEAKDAAVRAAIFRNDGGGING